LPVLQNTPYFAVLSGCCQTFGSPEAEISEQLYLQAARLPSHANPIQDRLQVPNIKNNVLL
jgi:hypothetical protein